MIIELRDVSKTYSTGPVRVTALRDVDLQVAAGEFVAVMGPSGSGKSTLMNLLGLLDRPTTGLFRFDGEDIGGKSDNYLARLRREKIGFIFQSFNLFPRANALKNVALPLLYSGVPSGERRRRAKAMLEQLGLADRMNHRPWELSGGQQQRVAIARALVNNPVLILADEPTGNLDSKTGESVLALLQELNDRGVSILVVTHDERVAHHTKRIIRLRDGMVIEDTGVTSPLRIAGEARDLALVEA
ncbi:MAG TPA: ABC transporter ATP-binding protein [Chloroflexia bacterium]|jgi:putative ABC transport system ATP-binding protein